MAAKVELVFLGTGAAGGTPGRGRSARRESSLLVQDSATRLLIDATHDFENQAARLDRIDAVLLTHGHRDASGGLPALRSWSRRRHAGPLPVLAHPDTIATLEARTDGSTTAGSSRHFRGRGAASAHGRSTPSKSRMPVNRACRRTRGAFEATA
jgi:metal-dependent hydrolase (beta-lactamase superfamily II)